MQMQFRLFLLLKATPFSLLTRILVHLHVFLNCLHAFFYSTFHAGKHFVIHSVRLPYEECSCAPHMVCLYHLDYLHSQMRPFYWVHFGLRGHSCPPGGNKELLWGFIYPHNDKLQIENVHRTAPPPR